MDTDTTWMLTCPRGGRTCMMGACGTLACPFETSDSTRSFYEVPFFVLITYPRDSDILDNMQCVLDVMQCGHAK